MIVHVTVGVTLVAMWVCHVVLQSYSPTFLNDRVWGLSLTQCLYDYTVCVFVCMYVCMYIRVYICVCVYVCEPRSRIIYHCPIPM